MSKLLIERFDKTGKPSAIFVTSSLAATMPVCGVLTYSASKAFASFISQGLNFELKDKKIDVMDYQAGNVATKL